MKKYYSDKDVKNVSVGKFNGEGYEINGKTYAQPVVVTFNSGIEVNVQVYDDAVPTINRM